MRASSFISSVDRPECQAARHVARQHQEVLPPLTSDFAEYVGMQRTIHDALFAAWAGNKSSADAISKADASLNELMKQLGYQP
jgi:ABC-type glycerol-3-phosphate transport system substrate-binding protein